MPTLQTIDDILAAAEQTQEAATVIRIYFVIHAAIGTVTRLDSRCHARQASPKGQPAQ